MNTKKRRDKSGIWKVLVPISDKDTLTENRWSVTPWTVKRKDISFCIFSVNCPSLGAMSNILTTEKLLNHLSEEEKIEAKEIIDSIEGPIEIEKGTGVYHALSSKAPGTTVRFGKISCVDAYEEETIDLNILESIRKEKEASKNELL